MLAKQLHKQGSISSYKRSTAVWGSTRLELSSIDRRLENANASVWKLLLAEAAIKQDAKLLRLSP
jgi:hypothetical protein